MSENRFWIWIFRLFSRLISFSLHNEVSFRVIAGADYWFLLLFRFRFLIFSSFIFSVQSCETPWLNIAVGWSKSHRFLALDGLICVPPLVTSQSKIEKIWFSLARCSPLFPFFTPPHQASFHTPASFLAVSCVVFWAQVIQGQSIFLQGMISNPWVLSNRIFSLSRSYGNGCLGLSERSRSWNPLADE